MYVILPITRVADQLYHCVQATLNHAPNTTYTGISDRDAIRLCQQLVDYYLSDRLFWTHQPNYEVFIDQTLAHYFPWWDQNEQVPTHDALCTPHRIFCDWFYSEAIDPSECDLRNLIADIIPENDRWCVWYSTPVQNDIMISKGEDYRIVEFEHRVLSDHIHVSPRAQQMILHKHRRTVA